MKVFWKWTAMICTVYTPEGEKLGIKTCELCESSTGYLRNFVVYTEEKRERELISHLASDNIPKIETTVKKLVGPLLGHWTYALDGQLLQ